MKVNLLSTFKMTDLPPAGCEGLAELMLPPLQTGWESQLAADVVRALTPPQIKKDPDILHPDWI